MDMRPQFFLEERPFCGNCAEFYSLSENSTPSAATTAQIHQLHLWVNNMDAVGADADYTTDYLRNIAAGDLAAHFHCHIEGQILHGRANDIWPAFRCLSQRIADAGHGGDTQGTPAPVLVARLPDSEGAAAQLQELESITAIDWVSWIRASLIDRLTLPPKTVFSDTRIRA